VRPEFGYSAIFQSPEDGVSQVMPLSEIQEETWRSENYAPEARVHQMSMRMRIEGPLDHGALRQALQNTLDCHDALRARLSEAGTPESCGRPALVIRDHVAVDLAVGDRADDAGPGRPFDRAAGPLIRFSVSRVAGELHELLITVHHLIADEHSLVLLQRHVTAAYDAVVRGVAPPSPPAARLADFSAPGLASARDAGDRTGRPPAAPAPWPEPLAAGALGPVPEPAGEGDPFAAGVVPVELPASVTAAVRHLAKAERATPFTAWLTALAVLAHRLAGVSDLVIEAASGERPAAAGQVVARLTGASALRIRVPAGATWREVLRSARECTRDAPGPADASAQPGAAGPGERVPGARPLAQLALTSPALLDPPRVAGHARFSAQEVTSQRAGHEIEVRLAERQGRTAGFLRYQTASLTSEAAAGLAWRLGQLIRDMAARPDSAIGSRDLLTDAERDQVLRTGAPPPSPYPRDMTVHRLFEARADMAPQSPALRFHDTVLTYGQLDQRANQLAGRLRSAGVRAEDRVGILLGHSGQWVISALAVLKAGAAYVPLDAGYPADRLAFMASDARLAAVISDTAHQRSAPAGAELVLLDVEAAAIAARPAGRLSLPASPRQLAYVMYTSGSTGRPKGAGVEHRNIVRLVRGTDYVAFHPGTVMGQASSVSFDAASFEVWGALLGGGQLVGIARDDLLSPGRLAECIQENAVNTLLLTTSLAHQLAHDKPEAVAGLTYLVVGGEQADRQALARLASSGRLRHLVNAYGPTECATIASAYPCDDLGPRDEPVPIGFPIANTRAYVLDQYLHLVPPGVPGELYVGGDAVGRGYPGQAALTAGSFVPDPFDGDGGRLYRTGDRAVHRADGALVFLGRVDRQLKIRGLRIEPGEVESALRASGQVAEASLQARLHPDGRPRLVGYVVLTPGGDARTAMEHVRRALPAYLVPEALVPLPAFPLTPNGKLDTAALPAPQFAADPAEKFREPRTATSRSVARAWAQALGLPKVGLDSNFFTLGGNSLTAVRVVSRLSEELGIRVTARLVFSHPTVVSCADAIDALRVGPPSARSDWASLVAVERGTRSLADLLAAAGITVEGRNND
jgi:amino acid adenylation domain-containing protein